MASDNRAPTEIPQTPRSTSTRGPTEVHIVTYSALNWTYAVTIDGSEAEVGAQGFLKACSSQSTARDSGKEWADKQLQHRLDTYGPPLKKTKKDRDAAFEDWSRSECEIDSVWVYTIRKDNEALVVQAQLMTLPVYSPSFDKQD